MPALDQCHDQVVRALEKAGWDTGGSPLVLRITHRRRVAIDIHASRQSNNGAEEIIIVEVKCFDDSRSELNDLYTAIGQYLVYRSILHKHNLSLSLYLAVPLSAYEGVFQQLGMDVVSETRIKMVIVDMELEEIIQWIE